MKRKVFFIIGCVFITIQVMAQSENKHKTLTKDRKPTSVKSINKPIQPIKSETKLLLPEYMELKSSHDTALYNTNAPNILPVNYNHTDIFPLYKRWFIFLEGDQKQYLNLASCNLAYMALGFRFNKKLNITGGLLAMKQFTNASLYGIDRSGTRFNLNYALTNQLEFNLWGQYLTGSTLENPTDNFLPQTGTGASMVLYLGTGSQIGFGAQYQYDNKKDKWNYQSGGKVSVNF